MANLAKLGHSLVLPIVNPAAGDVVMLVVVMMKFALILAHLIINPAAAVSASTIERIATNILARTGAKWQ